MDTTLQLKITEQMQLFDILWSKVLYNAEKYHSCLTKCSMKLRKLYYFLGTVQMASIEEKNIGQLTVRLLCSTENQGYKSLTIPCENSKTFLNSQSLIYPKALAHYLKHCFERTFILSQRQGRIFVDQAVLHELLKHIGSLKHCDPLLYYLCSHTSLDCLNSEQPT